MPKATAEYVLEKVPIVQWLPRYYPRWLLNDLVAGTTVGVLLVCVRWHGAKAHPNDSKDSARFGICQNRNDPAQLWFAV